MSVCPVCNGDRETKIDIYRNQHPFFANMDRVQCEACGLVHAEPMPDEKALDDYNSRYFNSAHGGHATDPLTLSFFTAMAEIRIGHVENYLKGKGVRVERVLEFGPGYGIFAGRWLHIWPDHSYHAVETDTEARNQLGELGVQLVDGFDFPEIDLVVMSHVLEHVTNPIEFLTRGISKLRRGGAVFIEVPCRDDLHKHQDEPHLLFFDKAPLEMLLRKVGLRHVKATYHGESLKALKSRRPLIQRYRNRRRNLIAQGLVAPFAIKRSGMERVTAPLARAVVAPFGAHRTLETPAWWLRACAVKAD